MPHPTFLLLLLLCACSGGGGSTTPLGVADQPAELVIAQARSDDPHRSGRLILRSSQGLGEERVADRSGLESGVRVHPDGVHLVFARQRRSNDPDTRELFYSTVDNSEAELRLTVNSDLDDSPCWSPDGESVLFSTERTGERRLWLTDRDGQNPRAFLDLFAGEDRDPDWSWDTDRIVFSRREGIGPWRLYLVQGNGTGLVPLTDGGAPAAGSDFGDREPAFSPDGSSVTFVRRMGVGQSQLMKVDVATGAAMTVLDPGGEVRRPRWSPHGDRLFCAVSQPMAGRPGLRLCELRPGGAPLLMIPDERFQYDGFDVLPALAPLPPLESTPRSADIGQAEVQLAAGMPVLGSRNMLEERDGATYVFATTTFEGREIAGINLRIPLPVADPARIAELRVEIVASLSRTDPDSYLRTSLHNPVEERFDTVVEIAPPDDGLQTLTYATTSLAHVTREREMRLTVIGSLSPGAAAELRIDYVGVDLIARQPDEE